MKKKIIFKGTATALITPFSDGKIDYSSFEKLIEKQLEAKIPALVVGGTTGEAATLSDTERYELYRFAKMRLTDAQSLFLARELTTRKRPSSTRCLQRSLAVTERWSLLHTTTRVRKMDLCDTISQ